MNGLAVVTVGSFAAEQKFMTCGMVGSLERNIQTIKGQRYKIQMKASPLGNGHVGYSPVLPAPFVRVLIDMFHKKEMILPKIAKEGRSVRVNFLEDTT